VVGIGITAETYTRFGIPIIPLGQDKNPLIGGFKVNKLSVRHSRAYMARFPDAEAFGVPDGRLSGLVRLDIDEPGDAIVTKVIERAGDTPFKVRTASRKMHLIFRANGERRLTARPISGKKPPSNAQPWGDLCVDLCGQGGYSVSPPSRCNGGTYELLGDVPLEDLLANRHRLPTIQGLDARAYLPAAKPAPLEVDQVYAHEDLRQIGPGNRDALFYREVARICQRVYLAGGTKDHAFVEAMVRHAELPVPHEDAEEWVQDKINYWWRKTEAGENRFGTGHRPRVRGWRQELAGSDPALHGFLSWLEEENGPDSEFKIANGLVGTHLTGWWSHDRLRDVRQRALAGEWIEMIAKPVQGRHALYRWGPTAFTTIFA
jgi:hypothetical protein